MILSNILSEPVCEEDTLIELMFSSGKIEKVDESGKIIGLADKEVLEFIDSYIEKNKRTKEKELVKYNRLCKSYGVDVLNNSYITETKEGEDFWEGFK